MTPPPARPRREPTPWVGPLFGWELVRLARRGQDARARTVLAVVLLVLLFLFTWAWFPDVGLRQLFFGTQQVLTLAESATFAERFVLTLLFGQMAVLVLLTPAYAAGGIAEEKEKRTFAFLLASRLSDREIVFGKFLGRLVFLLGVLFAGLPILALAALSGGVDPAFLLVAYLLTGTTVVLVSAVSVAAAVFADTFRGILFRAYGITALYTLFGGGVCMFLSPFAVLGLLHEKRADGPVFFGTAGGYMAAQLVVAVVCLAVAVKNVRRRGLRTPIPTRRRPRPRDDGRRDRKDGLPRAGRVPPAERLVPDAAAADGLPRAVPVADPLPERVKPKGDGEFNRRRPKWDDGPGRPRRAVAPAWHPKHPPVGDADPFVWKERHFSGLRHTADDDSIRGVMLAVGVTAWAVIGFLVLVAGMTALAATAGGREATAAARLMLVGGTAGLLLYLVTVGSAACGTVCRERQRQTLDSLLTIPVPRRDILAPKWAACATRGGWWGAAGLVALTLGFLASEVPAAAAAVVPYLLAVTPFAVSSGLWLSVRCRTAARAVVWFLPAAGAVLAYPLLVWSAADEREPLEAVGLLLAGAGLLAAGAWLFWRLALWAFEREGRG